MICPLCQTALSNQVDDQYYECSSCGALVKNSLCYLDENEEKERYELHENDIHDVRYQNFTSPITDTILEHYTPEHYGLDFGSGTGPVITHLLSKQGFNIRLYDPFFYPDEGYLNDNFDYIFSCEVFEHFKNPHKEISNLVHILKSHGRLIVMTHIYDGSTPFVHWYYRKDPTHIFIYTQKTIQFIAYNFNLEIEKMTDRLVVFRKKS